jgi:hypothetical protein
MFWQIRFVATKSFGEISFSITDLNNSNNILLLQRKCHRKIKVDIVRENTQFKEIGF